MMGYLKVLRGSIIALCFIQLSGVVYSQNKLLLGSQFIYPDEQLEYSYINDLQEEDNLLYLVIVDLQNQEIVDFVFHGLEDKIIEGAIKLSKNLVPGYYALLAAKYGSKEIHYEQFWVRDPLWRSLGGREMIVSEVGDSLKIYGKVTGANTHVSFFMTTESAINDTPSIDLNEAGEFEVFLAKDSILNKDMPVWALVELRNENAQLAIHRFPIHWPHVGEKSTAEKVNPSWISVLSDQVIIHAPEVGEFSIESMDEIIILEDPIFPEDTLSYYRSDLPTGKLKLHYKPINANEFSTEELWNYPQLAKEAVNRRIIAQGGEELALELPEIINPWVLEGNHFLSMKLDSEARLLEERYTGILMMADTLNSTLDMVTMRSNDPDRLRSNRAVMFTNGEYLLEFRTDENGAFSINRSEAPIYGFEEGRLRYREEESLVRLEATYPTIEQIKDQLTMLLGAMHPKIIEKDALLSNRAIEVDELFGNDERTIDLDEVVIQGQNMQERIDAVLNDPFAVDWLNEDWVCMHGVLNGELGYSECVPIIGNHPLSPERIPLHLIYERERLKQDPLSSAAKFKRLFYNPFATISYASKRIIDEYLGHVSKAWRPYFWDPDDYLDQIGSVKLPKQNKLLVSESELNISNGQKVWIPYSENPSLILKAPILPGNYILEIRYWDLHHEISSSISYEVLVR